MQPKATFRQGTADTLSPKNPTQCPSLLIAGSQQRQPHEEQQPHLAELREVILLTERTLPKASFIIPYRLVVALSLGPPVGYASHIADDHFTCGVMGEEKGRMNNCKPTAGKGRALNLR